jgi:tRNA(Ile)-lysidine synthase TilS/MesJ
MIRQGDKVMVGLSGGKDSALLLSCLCALRAKSPIRFTVEAVTIDPTESGFDLSPIKNFLKTLGVKHSVTRHPIFSILRESATHSPCSLCANIRRGILATHAKDSGCTSLALGHHRDDAVETVFLNLIYAGRFRCFSPNMVMSRTGIRVIRPFIYVAEDEIKRESKRLGLPVIDFECGYSSSSMRAFVKSSLSKLSENAPHLAGNVLHALKHFREDDAWVSGAKREDASHDLD